MMCLTEQNVNTWAGGGIGYTTTGLNWTSLLSLWKVSSSTDASSKFRVPEETSS